MSASVDLSPYGTYRPEPFLRMVLALTHSLPANWLGFRASTPFRRLAIDRLDTRPVDTELWGARMRLHPHDNSCEKNALFTPQWFDRREREVLAAAIEQRVRAGATFTFVDVGANVGLYSLFVASRGGAHARVLAVEPQRELVARMAFSLQCNPGFNVAVVQAAAADRDGEMDLVVYRPDRAGSSVKRHAAAFAGAEIVPVPCRPLAAMVAEAGITAIDALKIDVEGAEDLVLPPFLREAPQDLLPRLLMIEDRPDWNVDLYALLQERRYVVAMRTQHNVVFRLA